VTLTGGSTIGLAWVGGEGGGICERHRFQYIYGPSTNPNDRYSLNTLVSTQVNRGYRLPEAVTSLTATHELGHSFGAYHDQDFEKNQPECVPGVKSLHGNYIMSSQVSLELNKAHNWMFSKCTRRSMSKVVLNSNRNPFVACFERRSKPHCGNGVVEQGEECDCGTIYECAVNDPCCTPLSLDPTSTPLTGCRLKADCSQRVHRCCTETCRLAKAGVTCRERTDCLSSSKCDGRSRSCPAPHPVPDGTRCAGGAGQCKDGVCSVSPCQLAGFVDCLCRRPLNHACSVCCRCNKASEEACVPAQWLVIAPPDYSLTLPPGSPCIHGGVCDTDGRCVSRSTANKTYEQAQIDNLEDPTNSTTPEPNGKSDAKGIEVEQEGEGGVTSSPAD